MNKKKEFELETKCRAYARQNGFLCWKNENNGNKGIPDDSFFNPNTGRFFMVEFKKDTKQKPRTEQVKWLTKIPNNGFLIGSFEDFKKIIDNEPKRNR